MSNKSKRKNSLRNVAKKVKELGTQLNRLKISYAALNTDSVQKLERKTSSKRCENEGIQQGCLDVYVGEEKRRFVIPTEYLSHPVFLMVLEKAREEYGFKQEALMLPCDVDAFEQCIRVIHSSQSACGKFDLEALFNKLMLKSSLAPNE